MVPGDVDRYGREVDRRLRDVLGDRLVGTWFVGSVALGGYRPGPSDVDVAVVVSAELRPGEAERIAAVVSHAELTCPARKLELVAHPMAGVGPSAPPGGAPPLFNLGTGPGLEDHLEVGGDLPPVFWFVIDRAVAHRSGITISGPPAAEVVAEPARSDVLEAMLDSARWHRSVAGADRDAVLNGARAWRFAVTDVLGTKLDGAAWAHSHTAHAEVVAVAADADADAPFTLQRHELDGFLDEVEGALRAELE